jgi:two-component system phosphate regulon response regulator PhoB/two-component system alkaline phosphatase synthesis response regulator PhoP
MSYLVYIVDDEPDILELVELNLTKAGFLTETFERAELMVRALANKVPDLLVLDLMLPDADGMEVCRKLREQDKYRKLPIVMLTAKVALDDRIQGLDYGADDYITKPFSPQELVARIKAVLRRAEWETFNKVLNIDAGLQIDFNKFEVYVDNAKADLTLTEFKILQLLTKRPGWVYNRQQILDFLWGNDKIVIDRTVDVHVKHLRAKLGRFAGFIRNLRGVGYKFEPDADNKPKENTDSHDKQ